MLEFDLQRFDDEETTSQPEEAQPLPEELNGLPEDIARETLAEWEASQAQSQAETQEESQPETETESEDTQSETEPESQAEKPGAVPYERFKEKVDEANRLKAQLEEYQRRLQQQQQPPQPQPQKPASPPITPEFSRQLNAEIEQRALQFTGFNKDTVKEIAYAEDDDPRVAQWQQAKAFATYSVINELRQRQEAQRQQQQSFLAEHARAANVYNDYVQRAVAEPDFREVQNFAMNDFFSQLPPATQNVVATSYLRISRNVASPAEMTVVTNYFDQAKAAYRARAQAAKKPAVKPKPTLPRTDQVKGTASTGDGQLSSRDIEKMLEGDFTELDAKTQNMLCGLT